MDLILVWMTVMKKNSNAKKNMATKNVQIANVKIDLAQKEIINVEKDKAYVIWNMNYAYKDVLFQMKKKYVNNLMEKYQEILRI